MEDVVARLEAVAASLEATQGRIASGQLANITAVGRQQAVKPVTAPTVPAAGATNGTPLAAYEQLLSDGVAAALDAAEAIGGEVLRATRVLAEGFHREAAVLQAMEACCKPTDAQLQALLQPVGEQLVAAGELASGPRSPHQNQFKLVSEAAQSLSWVAYTGPGCGMHPPAQHVEETVAASEFYANKVLMEWRGKEPKVVAWVQALKGLLQQLKDFCARHFPSGPTWNSSGVPISEFQPGGRTPAAQPPAVGASSAAAAAAPAPPPQLAKKAPPAAPPPPPPGSLLEERPAGSKAAGVAAPGNGNPMAALFAEINKGDGITTGLRKVTADMKAKNRADSSGVVPAAAAAPSAPAARSGVKAAAGPPRFECEQGRKWVVENQVGNRELVIEDTNPKQTVYIYNCRESTVQVRGKVNSIALDKCSRTGLLFDNVVATVEVVNCQSVEVQCTGSVPTLAVDKSDGCQLYLGRDALTADITTAKSSAVNVVTPGASEDADPVESAIPEQFVTRYRNGAWVTEAVSHSAG